MIETKYFINIKIKTISGKKIIEGEIVYLSFINFSKCFSIANFYKKKIIFNKLKISLSFLK